MSGVSAVGGTGAGTPASGRRSRAPVWVSATIAVFFGLFYAYDVWEAVGNLAGLNVAAQSLDTQLSGWGWVVLIFAIVMPVIVYALVSWLGRRRGPGVQALLLFVGLCVVAAVSLDIFVMFGVGRLIV